MVSKLAGERWLHGNEYVSRRVFLQVSRVVLTFSSVGHVHNFRPLETVLFHGGFGGLLEFLETAIRKGRPATEHIMSIHQLD